MQNNSQQFDIAILGGGLAGLSLAAELAAPEFAHLKIVIIEPRLNYQRDKTWSYWRQTPHAFSGCERAVLQSWQVSMQTEYASKSQQNKCKIAKISSIMAEDYVYASIESDAFYRAALNKIAAYSNIVLLQEKQVQTLQQNANDIQIALNSGEKIQAKQTVFDSRPPQISQQAHLTQHFEGWQIMAKSPIFDENNVILMDFKQSLHGIHFMYILPFSSTEALIESTWLCQHKSHESYQDELKTELLARWPNVAFEVKYTEKASLPLITKLNEKTSSKHTTSAHMPWRPHRYWLAGQQKNHAQNKPVIIDIGARAGTARAATGYAFLETLQDSQRLAHLLKHNLPLTSFSRSKIDIWMDALFLSFLMQNPHFGANYFVQLFANCKPARLIRFLTGNANWRDRLSVILAVPAWPMLKHLLFIKK